MDGCIGLLKGSEFNNERLGTFRGYGQRSSENPGELLRSNLPLTVKDSDGSIVFLKYPVILEKGLPVAWNRYSTRRVSSNASMGSHGCFPRGREVKRIAEKIAQIDTSLPACKKALKKGSAILRSIELKHHELSQVQSGDTNTQRELRERISTLEHHISVMKNSLTALKINHDNSKEQRMILHHAVTTLSAPLNNYTTVFATSESTQEYRDELWKSAGALAAVDHDIYSSADRPDGVGRRSFKRTMQMKENAVAEASNRSDMITPNSPAYHAYREEQRHVDRWLEYEKDYKASSSRPWMRDYSNPQVAQVVQAMINMEAARKVAARVTAGEQEVNAYMESVRDFARKLKAAERREA